MRIDQTKQTTEDYCRSKILSELFEMKSIGSSWENLTIIQMRLKGLKNWTGIFDNYICYLSHIN